ncbi:MAG TPA: response regulator, partial [Gaiellaceae bacterium]|nr:response regulator [Gaiellaceae bacterium]
MTLAASVLLERLRDFRSTQLATYGLSAIPLVAACVAAGGGRYSGAVIRREPKAYGAGRRIDGALERGRPVVVVDESISSGTSVYEAARALEAEGYEVVEAGDGEAAVELLRRSPVDLILLDIRMPLLDGLET